MRGLKLHDSAVSPSKVCTSVGTTSHHSFPFSRSSSAPLPSSLSRFPTKVSSDKQLQREVLSCSSTTKQRQPCEVTVLLAGRLAHHRIQEPHTHAKPVRGHSVENVCVVPRCRVCVCERMTASHVCSPAGRWWSEHRWQTPSS